GARRRLEASVQLGVALRRLAPALHPSARLEARDGGDEVRTGQPVRGREGVAVRVVRRLLGDCRRAPGTAYGDAQGRARPAAELPDESDVVVHAAIVRTSAGVPGCAPPALDAGHDVQPLSGADEAELARLPREHQRLRRTPEARAQRVVLGTQA